MSVEFTLFLDIMFYNHNNWKYDVRIHWIPLDRLFGKSPTQLAISIDRSILHRVTECVTLIVCFRSFTSSTSRLYAFQNTFWPIWNVCLVKEPIKPRLISDKTFLTIMDWRTLTMCIWLDLKLGKVSQRTIKLSTGGGLVDSQASYSGDGDQIDTQCVRTLSLLLTFIKPNYVKACLYRF